MKGVLAVCDEPLVSVDFRCTDVSTSIDSSLTRVMGDDMVKVVAWYGVCPRYAYCVAASVVYSCALTNLRLADNEWGYTQRVVDLAEICAKKWE
jgi:glyceraldehyde-3-phosphate dehydrogenase (NADP+) (phosphorylating)